MKTNQAGQDLIKSYETLRLKAFLPTKNDRPTIGWGRARGVKLGDEIDEETAQRYFDEDLCWAEECVEQSINVPLTENQFAALVSLCYNIGATNFSKSTLVRLLNAGAKPDVAVLQFARWNKQFSKRTGEYDVLDGLTERRAVEAELFLKECEV